MKSIPGFCNKNELEILIPMKLFSLGTPLNILRNTYSNFITKHTLNGVGMVGIPSWLNLVD